MENENKNKPKITLESVIPIISMKPKVEKEYVTPINELFRNKSIIKTVSKFLDRYQLGKPKDTKGVIIRGPIGCGKLTLIKSVLRSLDYEYQVYDTNYESDDIFNRLFISIRTRKKAKRAIIIRDIDNSLRSSQKSKFYKFLNEHNNTLPILMTSHDISVGTTREVPKCIMQLDFELPFLTDLVSLCLTITESNKTVISKNALEKMAKESNGDIRFLINQVRSLKYIEKRITVKNNTNFIKNFQLDTFNGLKYCTSDRIWKEKVMHTSSYTNSTVFHNYPKISKKELHSDIADLVCQAEELRNFAYSNQEWDTFESHYCILGTVIPMTLIGDIDITKLTYPPSTMVSISPVTFEQLQEDSIMIVRDTSIYSQLEDPVRACKLGLINQPKKKKDSKLKEVRKLIKSKKTQKSKKR